MRSYFARATVALQRLRKFDVNSNSAHLLNRQTPPLVLSCLRAITQVAYRLTHTGLPRVAELIRKRTTKHYLDRQASANFWISDFMGRLQFCCDLNDHMGSQIFFRGAYSYDQLKLIETLFSEPYVFIDIGANQGEFSVFVASLFSDSQVLAFEPTTLMLGRLRANIDANDLNNVTVFPVGLSDAAQADVPIYGHAQAFDDGSFHSGLPTIYSIPQRNELLETISLQKLDDTLAAANFTDRVDLIKIDIEGAELPALQGAIKTITDNRPLIIFEASSHSTAAAGYTTEDLFQFFEAQQYVLHGIGSAGALSKLDTSSEFSNVLAVPQERDV